MSVRLALRFLVVCALAAVVLAVSARPAAAHPLGNFTTNVYAGLTVSADEITIDYVVDLAEIPAVRARQSIDTNSDDRVGSAEGTRYRARECARLSERLHLEVADGPAKLAVKDSVLTFPPGEAGLPTLRLECSYTTEVDTTGTVLFSDGNHPGRIGWREITATGEGAGLEGATVPTSSLSHRLTAYPEERLASPLDVRSAEFVAARGGGSRRTPADVVKAPLQTVNRLSQAFTELVAIRDLTLRFALAAALAATVLGSLHAAAPGHGKTLMAAYLVNRHGSTRQALGLGLTVAATHTLGVLILGVVVSMTQLAAPERVYPWLGAASGLCFAAVGALLLRRSLAHRTLHHWHGGDRHQEDHHHAQLTWRSLAAPGLAGGLVPSPSALLVLLGGIALGRAWFGVVLVFAYGVGMAASLMAAGWLLLRARTMLERRAHGKPGGQMASFAASLPVATACVVIVGGLLVAARSVAAISQF